MTTESQVTSRLCTAHWRIIALSSLISLASLTACSGGNSPTPSPAQTPSPTSVTYTVGGSVSGLTGGGLVLQNNGNDSLSISASGIFTFAIPVTDGNSYSVNVFTQPTGQICSVSTGAGTVSGGNVTNVAVVCAANTYRLGGTVTGLAGSVVLQNNSGDNLTVAADGAFTFATQIASGSPYSVTVLTQPTGQSCSVGSGTGTIMADVSNVSVSCATNTYTVGGMVTGLSGSVVLQNNGGNNLTLSVNGPFTFSTALTTNTTYSVTVLTQPTDQTCTVGNSTGTITANVTNVTVSCATNTSVVPRFVYVANYTSHNVSAYLVNPTTGELTSSGSNVPAGQGPVTVAVDPLGKFAYVANTHNVQGGNSISIYSIHATTGALTNIGTVAAGIQPRSVTVDPLGRFAYVASSYPPSILAYNINATTGALSIIGSVPAGSRNNALSVSVEPTGRFVYAASFDNPTSPGVFAYTINASTGALTSIGVVTAGRAPWSVSIHPAGRLAYVSDFVDSTVSVYAINDTSGALTPVTGSPFAVATGGEPITFEPSGKFAYVGRGSIYAYSVDATTGVLTPITGSPFGVGTNVLSVGIDPLGKYLYAGSSTGPTTAGNVGVYDINPATGALVSIGTAMPAGINPEFVTTTSRIQ